jgi:asparagine synthase (glutamine-hydrolysing)
MTGVGDRHRLRPAQQGFAGWVDSSLPTRCRGGVDVVGWRVWWRGFLANRGALIDELGCGADKPRSDEELVARACQRWGAAVQAHLIGEFALVALDQATNALILTHDAVGVVPLYYSVRGHTIYFGSHLSLLARLIPGLELDESYIAEFLVWGECLGERTIYGDVRRLGVGRTMRYGERSGEELRTWWLGEVPELRYRDPRDYEEHFCQLLQSAVATAVDGRTWSELSGGLDSSSIACVAHQLGVEDFETLSVVYSTSTTSDEQRWIDIVTREKRIPAHFIDGDEHKPFSMLPERPVEEPSRLHMMWPVFDKYETLLGDHGVNVLLTGFGGDQIFFGGINYPIQVADRVRRMRLMSAAREVANWNLTAGDRSLTHRLLTTGVIPAWSYQRGRLIRYEQHAAVPRRCGWVSPDLVRRRTGVGDRVLRAPTPRMPTVRGQAFNEQLWHIASTAGGLWSQNTTSYSWRYPLLYRPLVEFMYSLPWQQQVIAGDNRTLQRRALAGILPEQIRLRRTKSGPSQAIWEGLRTSPEVYELLTAEPLIAQRGYVDQTAWRAAVNAARFGHVKTAPAFEAAVSLEIWLRQQDHQL